MRIRKQAAVRKQEILEKAFALFQEKGYRQVTMDQIAQGCGVKRTSLYEYFSSKADILMALAEEAANETVAEPPAGLSCREQLHCLAESYLSRILKNRPLYKILFAETAALSPEFTGKLLEWRQTHAAHAAKTIELGRDSGEIRKDVSREDAVFLFLAMIGQRGGELLMNGENVEPAKEADRLCSLMWRGLAGN